LLAVAVESNYRNKFSHPSAQLVLATVRPSDALKPTSHEKEEFAAGFTKKIHIRDLLA
jgi:hypothetical protein